nr:reverse transcriptase domain-containing protein [Tanacetum cinerariifolium]
MAQLLQAPTEGYEEAIVIPEITVFLSRSRGQPEFGSKKNPLDPFQLGTILFPNLSISFSLLRKRQISATKSQDFIKDLTNHFTKHRNGTSSSTPAISSDVAELKDMVKALLLDKKNQSPAQTPSTTPASVKAVVSNCVTCGGQLHRPQVNQVPVYQAPIPQTQRVSQIDFESYVKANDAILRNMQSQGQSTQNQCQNIQNQNQNLQNQMATLTEMMSKLISANTASSSGSGTLLGNTVTNPKEDLKGITTRSGVAYPGPKTLSQSKQGTKVTKDQVQTPSSQSTTPVQPSVIQSESQDPVSELVVAPVMLKYGVTHRLSTAYHPQTSVQVKVSNHGLKRILERTIGENRASWSDKLDDALWACRTA